MRFKRTAFVVVPLVALSFVGVRSSADDDDKTDRKPPEQATESDRLVSAYARQMIEEGRHIFRYDTFGSEAFWGDALQLHRAIAGDQHGGVGGGVSPKTALSVGLTSG